MRALLLAVVCIGIGAGCAKLGGKAPADSAVSGADRAALDKLGWKVGCQAYTFRSMSLFETIDVLNRLGIRYVELYPGQRLSTDNPAKADHNMSPELIAQLKKKLRDSGVTAVSYGVVGLENEEQARRVFEFGKKMGMTTIVSEPPEDKLAMLDRLCMDYDIDLAIHNHPAPSHYWNVDTVVRAIQGRTRRVGACADDGHWYRSGLVPEECLRKLQGRIIEMHFKDIAEVAGNKQDVPWGTGNCDVRALLTELKRQGAKPMFAVEYEHGSGQELQDNVSKSVQYFYSVARDLAR